MRFGLLGPLSVHHGAEERTVSGLKQRILLAMLLLEADQPVQLDRLKAALWGERPPASASASIHNMVARLRRLIDDEEGSRLRSTPLGYLLHVAEDELDSRLFESRLRRARSALLGSDWESVQQEAGAALDLWRGVPLAELPDLAPAQAPRQQWQEARLQALEWRIQAQLRLGRSSGLVPELTRLVAEHPLHEAFHAQLMLTLNQLGQCAEALALYQRLRRALVEELGIEPGPAIREVHQQILCAEPYRPAPRPSPHRDPHLARDSVPAQLPADTPDFTGRATELQTLTELLRRAAAVDGGSRVVAISGMGGVGKTTLAVHVAQRLSHLFPDGQLYVNLRGFGIGQARDAHDLLAVLLTDLDRASGSGRGARWIPEHTDDRAAQLRTVLANRRVLLVLDNARDASHVLPLLPGNSRSAVIVTSRNTLADLPTATQLPLGPLDIEDQRALLSALCGPGRIQQDPDGALRILAACAGLPLALRISGARLSARPAWSLTTLAERLDDGRGRLQALTVGHLAVHATFAASYLAIRDGDNAVEREAARAFRLLGLWPGQLFAVESAAALLDRPAPRVGDLLELLADSHLLQTPAPHRYRFHDLLGEYAAERADEEEPAGAREDARLRLMIWLVAALEAASAAMNLGVQAPPTLGETPAAPLPVFDDAEQALQWCVQQLPNIKEAIRLAADCPRPDLAWRLAGWLFGYAKSYAWTGEWDDCLSLALRIAEDHGDLLGQAWMLRRIGTSHGMADRTEQAVEALEASLALFEELADAHSQAAVAGNLSLAHEDPDRALAYARLALRIQQRTGGDGEGEAAREDALARALRLTGDLPASERHFRRALALWRSYGNPRSVGVALASLGETLRALDRREEAFAALGESLEIRRQLGDFHGTADCLVLTGRAHLHFAQWSDARDCFDHAVDLGRQHGLDTATQAGLQGLDELDHAMHPGT
ncbi:DNA-binding SARP family transcriptional activator [Kitasatospora sp. MAA4]|uniref:AfsR/SARP family transcriptional regulator n=1 Tax=Kitasatospora sp. MAA4 TaxID=3035093 RepID=UPI00247627B9|nr:BTAD domain-containing putative transcriptional regulator [Kitasatospora sp. MAA4]MDH6132295.1 DNA-binding SARP family transcriptional activator [Kitasatospora sp. MAA4]